MDELAQKIARVRGHVTPDWSTDRAEHLLQDLRNREASRKHYLKRGLLGLGFASAIAASVALFGPAMTEPNQGDGWAQRPSVPHQSAVANPVRSAIAHHAGSGVVTLAEGSKVETHLNSELAVLENNREHVELSLGHGSARFDVVKRVDRQFTVRAGDVTVTVLGTIFSVGRTVAGVVVSVERGRVQVTQGLDTRFVDAGESLKVSPNGDMASSTLDAAEPTAVESPAARPIASTDRPHKASRRVRRTEAPSVAQRRVTSAPSPDSPGWRALAKAGDYSRAYRELQHHREASRTWGPAMLLDAADAARFSGHPGPAIRLLEQVTVEHPQSPMAPLAAFTLGRVCLDQMGQPHKAAAAFGLALELAPHGSLAQDALARRIEALSKGGRDAEAYRMAREYIERYPAGRRLHAVRKYGGLDQ